MFQTNIVTLNYYFDNVQNEREVVGAICPQAVCTRAEALTQSRRTSAEADDAVQCEQTNSVSTDFVCFENIS